MTCSQSGAWPQPKLDRHVAVQNPLGFMRAQKFVVDFRPIVDLVTEQDPDVMNRAKRPVHEVPIGVFVGMLPANA